jgi:group I intron endonuclease
MGLMIKVYGKIYLITCLVNGKKYVGQTVQPLGVRFRQHINSANVSAKTGKKDFYLHRSLRKHGESNFQISLLCSCENKMELDLMEDLYIAGYGTMNTKVGYNRKRGGANGKPSEATRKLHSQVRKGKVMVPAGWHHTEASKQKMSADRKGPRSYKYRRDISTEELVRLYETHTTPKIGKIFNIDPSTVGDRLKKAGVPIKTRSSYKGKQSRQLRQDVDTQKLVRLYKEGMNTKELSKMFFMTPASIANRIKGAGEKMRPRFFKSPRVPS